MSGTFVNVWNTDNSVALVILSFQYVSEIPPTPVPLCTLGISPLSPHLSTLHLRLWFYQWYICQMICLFWISSIICPGRYYILWSSVVKNKKFVHSAAMYIMSKKSKASLTKSNFISSFKSYMFWPVLSTHDLFRSFRTCFKLSTPVVICCDLPFVTCIDLTWPDLSRTKYKVSVCLWVCLFVIGIDRFTSDRF